MVPEIFISYAHIDNETILESEDGWITLLHRMLELRLAQLLGEKPIVWRDPQMRGNAEITSTLNKKLEQCDYMISVITPRYLKSDWCRREMDFFFNRFGDSSRIFKVIKTEVSPESVPKEVRDCLSYMFFRNDPDSGRIREFRPHITTTANEFINRLDDLAYDMCSYINEQISDSTGVENKSGLKIFLAESSYSIQEERDQMIRELCVHGNKIMPKIQLPLQKEALIETVTEILKECDLAIHLIGNSYGMIPENADISTIEIQAQLSAEFARQGKISRLIYVPQDIQPCDERQKKFLKYLESNEISQIQTEFISASNVELYQVLHEQLDILTKPEVVPVRNQNMGNKISQVYLICAEEDLEDAEQLEDYLFDQQVEPLLPLFEGDEAQIKADHLRNINACVGIIIYQGKANDSWLRQLRHDISQQIEHKTKPLAGIALFLGPPDSRRKQRLRALDMQVIQSFEQIEPQLLQEFISELGRCQQEGIK